MEGEEEGVRVRVRGGGGRGEGDEEKKQETVSRAEGTNKSYQYLAAVFSIEQQVC